MDGEVVIVTGAARGIGRWVARTFAEAGARLAIADVLPLDATSAELQKLEATFLPVQVDVRDEGAVAGMVRTIADHYLTMPRQADPGCLRPADPGRHRRSWTRTRGRTS